MKRANPVATRPCAGALSSPFLGGGILQPVVSGWPTTVVHLALLPSSHTGLQNGDMYVLFQKWLNGLEVTLPSQFLLVVKGSGILLKIKFSLRRQPEKFESTLGPIIQYFDALKTH